MTGDELRRFRERRQLSKGELAELLNQALDRKYDGESVARWERGDRRPSRSVVAFVEDLAASELGNLGSLLDTGGAGGMEDGDAPLAGGSEDTAPGPGPMAPQAPMLSGSSTWGRACEELWELIATGVGMIGAAVNNPALVNDGAIIAQDKAALGAAWGRLAETNETFRRMLVGMTEGGAWLQVSMVTGTTLSKCWQSHAAYAAAATLHAEDNGHGAEQPVAA